MALATELACTRTHSIALRSSGTSTAKPEQLAAIFGDSIANVYRPSAAHVLSCLLSPVASSQVDLRLKRAFVPDGVLVLISVEAAPTGTALVYGRGQ